MNGHPSIQDDSITNCAGRIKRKGMMFLLNLTNTSMLKKTLGWRKSYGLIHRLDTRVYLIVSLLVQVLGFLEVALGEISAWFPAQHKLNEGS
jgi:hypothetical protein